MKVDQNLYHQLKDQFHHLDHSIMVKEMKQKTEKVCYLKIFQFINNHFSTFIYFIIPDNNSSNKLNDGNGGGGGGGG
jgi:hypothetical protein